ncbi:DNA-binding transcriptional LysR family regulator [Roseateles depolymerans]|uniref:Transcriptional regulator, LysR family n=2 Tax=Roseateles depolymerans TaxID=76731 RepID=A0A0U3M8L8_9BURK|nr:Transcriptional regulator, LysR family [Roseateles depolymerans]REG15047.1 DNA-binding transcriptional LysR family regulator [Roseateles depolymerans]
MGVRRGLGMRRTDLSGLQAVAAVAARQSFRAAAADLGQSASAVSHAVSALEARMGVRLFHRTTRSVALSEAGREFLARIAPALQEIEGAMDATRAQSPRLAGTLRINTSEAAAHQLLASCLPEYLQRYPDMQVDVVTEGRMVDIVAEGFDAGIRLASSVPQDMVAARFGPEQGFVVVGSPAYLRDRPAPTTPHDLSSHRCIRNRLASGALWRWEFIRQGETVSLDVDGPLTLDDNGLRLQAALAGIGLVYINAWAARPHLQAGRLVQVLQDWTPGVGRLALYYPGQRLAPAGLRALVALLREVDAREGDNPPG